MHRRLFITTLAAAACFGSGAFAQGIKDEIISQLTAQGFTRIVVSRTLLGRLRFVATNDVYRREIVINPNTEEVLRDYLVVIATGQPPKTINIPPPPDPGDDNSDNGGGDANGGDSGDDSGGDDSGGGDSGGDSGGGGDDSGGGDSGGDSGGGDDSGDDSGDDNGEDNGDDGNDDGDNGGDD